MFIYCVQMETLGVDGYSDRDPRYCLLAHIASLDFRREVDDREFLHLSEST